MFSWYRKTCASNWAAEFDRFSEVYSALGKPPEMMLIANRHITVLYASLDPSMLEALPGYELADDLPKQITFLVGNPRAFKLLEGSRRD
jgi:hypothetical protein